MVLFNPLLEGKRVHIFLKGISPKMNVIAWLKFKLPHWDVAVQYISYYMSTLLYILCISWVKLPWFKLKILNFTIFIQGDLKKILTPLWEYLYDISSNSLPMFSILVNTFFESSIGD